LPFQFVSTDREFNQAARNIRFLYEFGK